MTAKEEGWSDEDVEFWTKEEDTPKINKDSKQKARAIGLSVICIGLIAIVAFLAPEDTTPTKYTVIVQNQSGQGAEVSIFFELRDNFESDGLCYRVMSASWLEGEFECRSTESYPRGTKVNVIVSALLADGRTLESNIWTTAEKTKFYIEGDHIRYRVVRGL